ncbi:glycosyltransferase family 2 protein [Cyanobacterium aponinum FACHB-4101]|uniref:glycosyltransferase n=1 Tax=Cyanobacterium aponinum TaxID=379064 RepID=UPI001680DE00|nr:glycosyltransferase family 2 protein [Cyanobacterium aponinum]MBD2393020.1 glycosyltransferase family 2 protein [Cyanobacterium aponinum FACHB-4101]
MPNNHQDNYENQELDPITSFIDEFSDPEMEEEEFRSDFFQGLSGRRKKAAFALGIIWILTVTLHLVSWSVWIIAILGIFVTIQALRLMFVASPTIKTPELEKLPYVSLMVSAKNEEAVVAKLVKMLANVNYPRHLYDFWVINDNSSDRTGIILDELKQEYPQLKVLHRDASAKGGKSGALNQAFLQTKGEIVGVFDADAIIPRDILLKTVPLFTEERIGAIQVRKSISNSNDNFWTKGQSVEMALDSYFQQQRIACGGMGELRGNGQFVRRLALESCGGWNEETITDDLDLTIRLHLDHWDIGVLEHPAVEEEGVKGAIALWHQRSRWAEGGYQRYLDYWRFIISNRLNWQKKFDLLYFFMVQYIFPTAAIPDLIMVTTHHTYPLIAPLSSLTLFLAFWGMIIGLKRTNPEKEYKFADYLQLIQKSILGMIYMTHWFIVMPVTTGRMSIRQKRLKWVKTVHEGDKELAISNISN